MYNTPMLTLAFTFGFICGAVAITAPVAWYLTRKFNW